jgi:hypothetical protein
VSVKQSQRATESQEKLMNQLKTKHILLKNGVSARRVLIEQKIRNYNDRDAVQIN